MKFKPIDEMSLRHLFSTTLAQEILRFTYLGPVLTPAGSIESSPDCLILDMRKHPFKPIRCEFKFIPTAKEDFLHNGKFDIAIVWSLPKNLLKEKLLHDLIIQNDCSELIILEELKAFRDLPAYTFESPSRLNSTEFIKKLALKRELPSVYSLYIAAKLYPNRFHMDKMIKFLATKFPSIKKMKPTGRANVVSAFLQTKPPLLEFLHGNTYRWTSEFDSVIALTELNEILRVNFDCIPPTKEELELVTE